MIKLKNIIFVICLTTMLIFSVGCSNKLDNYNTETSQSTFHNLEETNKPGVFKMCYEHFEGTEIRTFNVEKGDKVKFNYSSANTEGHLSILITDPYGTTLVDLPIGKKGSMKIVAKGTGRITLTATGKNTSGSFEILWKKVLF